MSSGRLKRVAELDNAGDTDCPRKSVAVQPVAEKFGSMAVAGESVLEGIEPPTGCHQPSSPSFEEWSCYRGELLGQNPSDGRLHVYIWKSYETHAVSGPDDVAFSLHVYRFHPVTKKWAEVLTVADVKGHVDDHGVGWLLSEPDDCCTEHACFDFEGREAGFWLLPDYALRGSIFVLWNIMEDQYKIYRIKKFEPKDILSLGYQQADVYSLGYSSYHRSFVAVTRDPDVLGAVVKLQQLLLHEDDTFEFQSIPSSSFPASEFGRSSFCPSSVAVLRDRKLHIYDYGQSTWESFDVVGGDYDTRPNEEAVLRTTRIGGVVGHMQALDEHSFIFPYEYEFHGACYVDSMVKITRWGSHYEATTLPNPWLPLRRFRHPENGMVMPLNQEEDVHTTKKYFTMESVELASQSVCVVVYAQISSNEKVSCIVEIPIHSSPEWLSVLAAKEVVKNSEELWKGDELETGVIAQKLGIPENLVKKYFE